MALNNSISPKAATSWRLGVDVGFRSCGLAAVEYDHNTPCRILSAVSWIHDGGADPSGGTTPVSRKYSAGVARRVRRSRRHRRQQLAALRRVLNDKCQIPTPNAGGEQEENPWIDRSDLSKQMVSDLSERNIRLGRAIMHIANHRGWRNAWWDVARLSEELVPSEAFGRMQEHAANLFHVPLDQVATIGQIGALALTSPDPNTKQTVKIRPRTTVTKGPIPADKIQNDGWLLFERVRQEDVLQELKLICKTQGLSDADTKTICEATFYQNPPYVKGELIGRDPFDPTQYRSTKGSLEFQEFRIRDHVAHLRISNRSHVIPLPDDKYEQVVQCLLNWDQEETPTWNEVAELCDILDPGQRLKSEYVGAGVFRTAPIDESGRTIRKLIKDSQKRSGYLYSWWQSADPVTRADFVTYIADPAQSAPESMAVQLLLESVQEAEFDELQKLKLPVGRAAYSRESLARLNNVMASKHCDSAEARWEAFADLRERLGWTSQDDARLWTPPNATFEEQTGNPTVDRNLALVRRFIMTATAKWGSPERIVIRHSREAFMSEDKTNAVQREQNARQRANIVSAKELVDMGITRPSRNDLVRQKLLRMQDDICLYCGTQITFQTAEINHIVPRTTGGSGRLENLAVVCTQCRQEKGKLPYGSWAKNGTLRTSLKDVEARVNGWSKQNTTMTTKQLSRYKKEVKARLGQMVLDDPVDEQVAESTAWAAVAVRERVQDFLEKQQDYDPADKTVRVQVYNARIISLARDASDIVKTMRMRSADMNAKVDRRHHAVDALILTTITPAIARELVWWDDLRDAERMEIKDKYEWEYRDFKNAIGDQILYDAWQGNISKLTDLGKEMADKDRIPVVRPLRLGTRVGILHKETVKKLITRTLGDEFTEDEIKRVVDKDHYLAIINLPEYKATGSLKATTKRVLTLPDGRQLSNNSPIKLFPGTAAAMLATQNGAVGLNYIHHARIYAWKPEEKPHGSTAPQNGAYEFGMVRVFSGEFARIGLLKKGVDLFRHEIPRWSESWRLAGSVSTRFVVALSDPVALYSGKLIMAR